MRILLISHSPLVSGGAEKCLLEYVDVLISQGHECRVIVPSRGEMSRELSSKNIDWSVANYVWATKPTKEIYMHHAVSNAGNSLASIFIEVEKYKPEVIITNTVVVPWGHYVGRSLNIPTILLVHEALSDKNHVLKMEPNYEGYVNVLDKNVDYVIYNSLFTKNDYSSILKSPVASRKILYPVPSLEDRIDSMYVENKIDENISIAIIGSIQERKNQLEAFHAAKILLDRNINNFTINLYGDHDPKYLNKVKLYIKDNNLENHIKLKGYTDDVYKTINKHNVIVSTFLFESFGRVVLEGQLFGRIVIANDTGAGTELVEDMHNGLIYKSGNATQLAEKLEWVIKNKKKALMLGVDARDEQRRKYLSEDRYDALIEAIKYFSKRKDKDAYINRFDPLISLSTYATGLEHKYRHIHKLTHNRVTRYALHNVKKTLRPIYHRFK